MSEKMLSAPIRIGTWEGEAFYDQGSWWIRPKLIADWLGLNWDAQLLLVKRNYPSAVQKLRIVSLQGTRKDLMVVRVGVALVWLARVGSNYRLSEAAAVKVKEFHMALASQFDRGAEGLFVMPVPTGETAIVDALWIDDADEQAPVAPDNYAASVGRTAGFLRSFARLIKGGRRDA